MELIDPRDKQLQTPQVSEDYEKRLKSLVYKKWKEIQKDCRRLDLRNKGEIPGDEFVGKINIAKSFCG